MKHPDENNINRKSVRLGRTFAGSIAVRLDAHPGTAEGKKMEDEKRIIALARKVLSQKEPDACAVNFLSQAVEMHTKMYDFSQAIYDELFRLNEARGAPPPEAPKPASDLSKFLVATGPKKKVPVTAAGMPRLLKA